MLGTFFVSPSLLDATNAWIPPLQIAGRETFWPIAALLFLLRPPTLTSQRVVSKASPPPVTRCELLLSGVIFGMDDSR